MKKTSDAEKIFRQNANLNPASFCLLSEVMTELKHTKKVLCLLMFCQKTVCVSLQPHCSVGESRQQIAVTQVERERITLSL